MELDLLLRHECKLYEVTYYNKSSLLHTSYSICCLCLSSTFITQTFVAIKHGRRKSNLQSCGPSFSSRLHTQQPFEHSNQFRAWLDVKTACWRSKVKRCVRRKSSIVPHGDVWKHIILRERRMTRRALAFMVARKSRVWTRWTLSYRHQPFPGQ